MNRTAHIMRSRQVSSFQYVTKAIKVSHDMMALNEHNSKARCNAPPFFANIWLIAIIVRSYLAQAANSKLWIISSFGFKRIGLIV